jgi:hypothetical protein
MMGRPGQLQRPAISISFVVPSMQGEAMLHGDIRGGCQVLPRSYSTASGLTPESTRRRNNISTKQDVGGGREQVGLRESHTEQPSSLSNQVGSRKELGVVVKERREEKEEKKVSTRG